MSWLGIDLGTSFCSTSIIENGKPVALKVATSGGARGDSFSLPSSVFLKEGGGLLLGQAADNNRLKAPDRYRDEFKRDLGQNIPYNLGDKIYLPEDLYKEFYKYFKVKAEERTGNPVNKVVITYPANYGKYKRDLMTEAAKKAGFGEIRLLDEPTAAAIYYATLESIKAGEKILVYDLGGGTFDIALIKKEEDDSFTPLTEPLGIEHCGGIDFDRKIIEDIRRSFQEKLNPILSKRDINSNRLFSIIHQESIKVKRQLTTDKEAFTSFQVSYEFEEYKLTREKFEEMIGPDVENTCKCMAQIVKNAGLQMEDIDKILLVGGSTSIPYVRELVERAAGKPVNLNLDPELAICFGAAVYGETVFGYDNSSTKAKQIEYAYNSSDSNSQNNPNQSAYTPPNSSSGYSYSNKNPYNPGNNYENNRPQVIQTVRHKDAIPTLIFGILSFALAFGLIFGPMALIKGKAALREIDADKTGMYSGRQLVVLGRTLAKVGLSILAGILFFELLILVLS